MKIVVILLLLLSSYLSEAQLTLNNLILNDRNEKDFKENFLKYLSKEDAKINLPSTWRSFNVNYLKIKNEKAFNPFNKKTFLLGLTCDLDENGVYSYYNLIDTSSGEIFLYSVFKNNKKSSFNLSMIQLSDKSFVEKIKFLNTKINLKKVSIFYLLGLKEMFLIYNNKVYVVEDNKLFDVSSYLKKKYKNKTTFIKEYKSQF